MYVSAGADPRRSQPMGAPVVFITWVRVPIGSRESTGRLTIVSRESMGSPTQVRMTAAYARYTRYGQDADETLWGWGQDAVRDVRTAWGRAHG